MSHVNESLLKYTAIYRCCDDITNLQIRVKLKENDHVTASEWEQKVLRWQQKAFSITEREMYKDEKNCVTDLEKKYHVDVATTQPVTRFNIFSYVNGDDYVKEQINDYVGQKHEEDDEDNQYDFKKSVLSAIQAPVDCIYEFDAMFIMADFGEYVDNTWIKNETVLCVIKYDKKYKILSVYPDFTNNDVYTLKIDGSTPRTFIYTVENVSEAMSEELRLKERKLIDKINTDKVALQRRFDASFVLPPKNKLQISLHFEILWAQHFEHDTIYVQYFIDLPANWFCDESSSLQGMTHTCRAKGDEGSAHFGHVFDAVLSYNIEQLEAEIPKCPYIYFEVISRDSWGRYRTEGLTYTSLPISKPGSYRFVLQCFRLVPNSVFGQLRRFFVGDCSNYTDISWIGLPKDHTNTVLNKYGSSTVGTGQIGLRFNVVHQSQAFLDCERNGGSQNREIFEKLNASSLVKSVEQVLLAFKRARKNMLAVRKNV